jgi:hypothetical protein
VGVVFDNNSPTCSEMIPLIVYIFFQGFSLMEAIRYRAKIQDQQRAASYYEVFLGNLDSRLD